MTLADFTPVLQVFLIVAVIAVLTYMVSDMFNEWGDDDDEPEWPL